MAGRRKEGLLKPGSEITIVKETPTTLMVDGNSNFGHYGSHHVMLRPIEKARTQFVAGSIRYQCARFIPTPVASRAIVRTVPTGRRSGCIHVRPATEVHCRRQNTWQMSTTERGSCYDHAGN